MAFQGNHALWGLIHGFVGLTCFASQLCENMQFAQNIQLALNAIHACRSLISISFAGDDKHIGW